MSPVNARRLYVRLEQFITKGEFAFHSDVKHFNVIPPVPQMSLAEGTIPDAAELQNYWKKVRLCMQEWVELLDQELPQ